MDSSTMLGSDLVGRCTTDREGGREEPYEGRGLNIRTGAGNSA